MAGMPLDILNSIPGTRLMVWMSDVGRPLCSLTGIDKTGRPWGNAQNFDSIYFQSSSLVAYPLACMSSKFKFGSTEGYTSAGDAPPGIVRMKMQRMGAYEQNLTFPLLVTDRVNNPLSWVYPIIEGFVKNSRSQPNTADGVYSPDIGINMVCVRDSYQGSSLPYVMEKFSINVSGVGQASPVQCSLGLKGIGSIVFGGMLSDGTMWQFPSRNPLSLATSYSRDRSAPSPTTLTMAEVGTARTANIKDCWVSLGGLDNQVQVVNMELNVSQSLDLRSTAGYAPSPIRNTGEPFVTDDHIYMSRRIVQGSFSFLASSAVDPTTGFQNSRFSPFSVTKGATLALNQWSSPITRGFGPLSFSMPAAYWQPSSHDLSSGSTIYTVQFIARTIDPYGNREMI